MAATTTTATPTTTTTTTTAIGTTIGTPATITTIPIPAWANDTIATRMHHYALAVSKLNEFEIQHGVGESLDDISYDRWMRRREKVISCRTKFASALDSSFSSSSRNLKKPSSSSSTTTLKTNWITSRQSLAIFWMLCICINHHFFPGPSTNSISISWFAPAALKKRTSKKMQDFAKLVTKFWWVINLSSGAWQVSVWCRAVFLALVAVVSVSKNPKAKPKFQLQQLQQLQQSAQPQQQQQPGLWGRLFTILKTSITEPCTATCFLLGRFKERKSELERVYPEIRNLKNIPPVQYVAYVDELEQFTAKKLAWEIRKMKLEREELLKTAEMATASLQGIMKAIKRQKKMLNEVRGLE
ncbi:hypothetical protein BZA77DRAFT_390440 [Pyronema omphalodes]|nr:hypothetical protein BZA77DRAFT_390440 [Pyronema omphalodes]